MDIKSRKRLLHVIDLANTHPAYAELLGIETGIKERKEGINMSFRHYYLGLVTDNPNHNHEVHVKSCPKIPNYENSEYLGYLSTSQEALRVARTRHPEWDDIDGCIICCSEIHTG